MNNVFLVHGLRFVFLVLLQVLVFKRVAFSVEGFNYVSVIIYPIFIILLPHRIPHVLLVFLGFLMGLAIDIFYSSPGLHAAALVFTAFCRPFLLKIFEPRGGYNQNQSPTKSQLGINTFVFYAASLMALHLIAYFSIQAFSLVYLGEILLRTIFGFIPSLLFVVIYQYLFDPKS